MRLPASTRAGAQLRNLNGKAGLVLIALIVLAATTTESFHPSSSSGSCKLTDSSTSVSTCSRFEDAPGTPAKGIWDEGGLSFDELAEPGPDFVPCNGSALQCQVVNKAPLPKVDFRNITRRTTATNGLVAADNSRCSEIGRDVLSQGGNAVDAAVAVALCSGVVNPGASGLGGVAFIMIRMANGTAEFVDARETAPAAATADMYDGLPSTASLYGGLAAAVPGELHGLAEIHTRYGVKPWSDLVQPAAKLAREGFAAHPYLVHSLNGPVNRKRIASDPALREVFMIKPANASWRLPHIGELCCQRPALADTLDKIAQQGASHLSSPAVAAAMASDLAAAGGVITAQDFQSYTPAVRQPLRVQLGVLELLVPPPPSSAAVVAFALQFLSSYGNTLQSSTSINHTSSDAADGKAGTATGGEVLGANGQPLASFGANAARDGGLGLHHLVEAMKHGFAVRTALGDPGAPEQPFEHAEIINAAVADLLSDEFVDNLRKMTRDNGVIADESYGGRWNPLGAVPANESGTSHFCVVDKDRNAVSLTTSVNGPFGSGVISHSTGILFSNTMDDFAQSNKSSIVTPHAAEANFIAPGKRPLSAMSPIIVTHKATGRLVALTGASGGPLIVSATLQTLARLLLEGVDVSEAVSGPRLHDQLLPKDDTYFENFTWGHTSNQLPAEMVQYLKQRGQVPTSAGSASLGISQAIHVLYDQAGHSSSETDQGLLVGQSDSRKDGAPLGY